jgi:hypothetical protein
VEIEYGDLAPHETGPSGEVDKDTNLGRKVLFQIKRRMKKAPEIVPEALVLSGLFSFRRIERPR